MTDQLTTPHHIELAAEIVSAFVSNNNVTAEDLPGLIALVHGALENLGKPVRKEPEKLVPPMPIKKTITPDFLISLEDGKRYKSLKRHLSGRGLTPETYREKWGLPRDYPMVAPNYSARRSELARSMGLGQQRTSAQKRAAKTASTSAKVSGETPKRRGRKKAG
jgi:predicted transcriptional regulator